MSAAWIPPGLSLVGAPFALVQGACLASVFWVLLGALLWVGKSRLSEPLHMRGRNQKRIVMVAALAHLGIVALTHWPFHLSLLASTPALDALVRREAATFSWNTPRNVQEISGLLPVRQIKARRTCSVYGYRIILAGGQNVWREPVAWYYYEPDNSSH
jgi:hypothetical protein